MQSFQVPIFISLLICSTHSVILKTQMVNDYPQVAVLGCDSNKANLYYDTQEHAWIEHLVSSCVNNEQSILQFCQTAYPSLPIGNIVRLDKVLRFEDWCEILPPLNNNDRPRCKTGNSKEELVQPFRCLYMSSKREELTLPNDNCKLNSIVGTGQCLRAERWQQIASISCSNNSMVLNNSLMTADWCGLEKFRGVEFICCPLKDTITNNAIRKDDNYFDDNDDDDDDGDEDDPVQEPVFVPKTGPVEVHQKVLAMSSRSEQPSWMTNDRYWDTMPGYFTDEDIDEDDDVLKLSSAKKSQFTINEHERFTKDKENFRNAHRQKINQLKLLWQQRLKDIQQIANVDPAQVQQEFQKADNEFRREYDMIVQTANRERTRINELHESNLDAAIIIGLNETSKKLVSAWQENPLQSEHIEDALYNYIHVLLRDRIHLVNRYERLRVVEPEQAKRKYVSIHERLRSIANQINNALNKLQSHPEIQSKIQQRIDNLIDEYSEVNEASERLLKKYPISLSAESPIKTQILPLGRDENKIYPFTTTELNKVRNKINNDEYDTANDDYDDEVDEDDDNDDDGKSSSNTVPENNNNININNYNEQSDTGISDWDVGDRIDATFNVKIATTNDEQQYYDDSRPLIPNNDATNYHVERNLFITYLPYFIACLLVLCIIIAVSVIRCILQQRRNDQYGNKYEKRYTFQEVDSNTPEDRALHALQMNGYENPTYKFFEGQTLKC